MNLRQNLLLASLIFLTNNLSLSQTNSSLEPVSYKAMEISVTSAAQATLTFSDITLSAGTGGPTGAGQTGGHAALFTDVDGDGRVDLYHTMLFETEHADLFFRNLGNNQFAEEGVARGIADSDGGSHGSVFGDLDNDGDFDLFNGTTGLLTSTPVAEHNNVFRNDGSGFFTDVTDSDIQARTEFTRGVAAFDMDGDGDLDLVAITNYQGTDDPSGERNEVYRNDSNFNFTAITSGALYTAPAGQGVTDTDFDGDGDIDIIAGNRTGPVNILRNNGSGGFTLVSPASVGISHQGREGVTMGDLNNDGHLDILLSDYDENADQALEHFYLNDGDGTFTYKGTFVGTGGYMGAIGDLDNDGDSDIIFAGDNVCYLNNGNGTFAVGPSVPITGINDPRGMALADIDNDGDLDFAIGAKRSRNYLIRNDLNSGNWLKVNLVSPAGQIGAFGAKVRIYANGDLDGDLLAFQEARSSNGYLGQNDPVLHFGLGNRSAVDIAVTFVDGTVVSQSGVQSGQTITISAAQQAPVVNSFSPGSGPVGTEVIILGDNFSDVSAVRFGGVLATNFSVDSAQQVRATVPGGAQTGLVSVTTSDGIANSSSNFVVTQSGGGATFSFQPTDDGQVKLTDAGSEYGDKSTMKLDSGKFQSYLKFNISGVTGSIQSAVVRLHVSSDPTDGGESGGAIHTVSNNFHNSSTSWNEIELNAGNAPVISTGALDQVGEVAASQVVDFDVTAAVSGNGIHSFALAPLSGDEVKYYTKEGAYPPELIISTSGQSGNQPPVAVNDQASTDENVAVAIPVAANDSDPDGSLDLASVQIQTPPGNGTTSVSASGVATYTPLSGFSGSDSFTYTIQDDEGATSNSATVSVTVIANTGGGGSEISFLPTDDGQIKLNNPTENYGDKSTTKVDKGSFRTYLKFNVSGLSSQVSSAKVRLQVSDGSTDGSDSGGEIYLVGNTFNNSGSAWTEAGLNAGNAPSVSGSPLSSLGQVSPDEIVEFDVTSAVAGNGTFSFAIISQSGDQVKYYTKEGAAPPELIVTTGSGGSSNQPPVAQNDNATTTEDIPVVIVVAQNDSDPDGSLDITSVQIVSAPSNGSVAVNGANGVVTYTPNSGFSGTDQFSYQIKDNEGASSNTATVTITVNSDGGGGSQTLSFAPTQDGQIKLTDASENYGDKSTTKAEQSKFASYFKFSVSGLTSAVQSAKVRLRVTDGTSDGSESGGAIYLVSNFQHGATSQWNENNLTAGTAPQIGGSALSSLGSVERDEVVEFDVTSAVAGNGVFSFAIYNSSSDQVKYYTREGEFPPELLVQIGSSGGGNQTPVAANDQATTNEDNSVVINLIANDSDPDGSINAASVVITATPAHGTASVNSSGQATYTPASNYHGQDAFSYTVKDNAGQVSNMATVSLTINPVNDPPVASDDNATVSNASVVVNILENDSDPDDAIDPTTVAIVTSPAHGSVVVNPSSGIVTYTPDSGFSGSDSFVYTVKDNAGATSNQATVTITGESSGGEGTTFVFEPTDDGQVKFGDAGSNYGSKATMKVESGDFESYMKFEVTGLTGAVTSAKLQLFVGDDSDDGGALYQVSNFFGGTSTSWTESELNAGNVPYVLSGALQALGAVQFGQILELDVTSVVQNDGIYSFLVRSNSTDQTKFGTKEGTNPIPQLIVVAGGDPPVSPVISSFSPTSGSAGTVVTISGQNLSGASQVLFGGAAASFNVVSDTQISATAPGDAVSGNIQVQKSGLTATSAGVFTVETAVAGEMEIVINADDEYELYVNGQFVGSDDQWNVAQTYTTPLVSGLNVLAVKGTNGGGSAGLLVEVRVDGDLVLRTDAGWKTSLSAPSGWQNVGFDDSGWTSAASFGTYGADPWKKNIADFPSSSSAEWIWRSNIPDQVYLRGGFVFGPQISSFSPGIGVVGTEVTISGRDLAPGVGASANPIRIMPLGDSITRGVSGSTDNAGYRNDLANLLSSAGIAFDFVGSLQHGSGFDNDNEGHNGYWADEVLAELEGWLNQNPPDMILFHIGTNDISSDQSNSSTISEIGQNLDIIHDFDPDIITILAGIIPRTDSKDGTTTSLVNSIQNLVLQRQAAGDKVHFVNMNSAFKASSNWASAYYPSSDNVHPNDIGYGVMAGVWFDGINSALAEESGLTVAFNGVPASQISVDSQTQIRAIVPAGATTGPISISNSHGATVSSSSFVVQSTAVAALEFVDDRAQMHWKRGETQTLRWNTLGSVERVRLELSADAGASWQTLSERTANTGRYVLRIPAKTQKNVILRIADADNPSFGVNEFQVNVAEAAREFPNLFEVRAVLFGERDDDHTDLNKDGKTDIVDFVNLLDLDNRGLRALAGGEAGRGSSANISLEFGEIRASGGEFEIPLLATSDVPVRAFEMQFGFDPEQVTFADAAAFETTSGMEIESRVVKGKLHIFGYLEKEGTAVEITGEMLVLRGQTAGRGEGTPNVRLVSSLFVSKDRLPIALDEPTTSTSQLPGAFSLSQNYPNPFNPETQIKFELPQRSKVEIKVYNVRGELVQTLVNEEKEPGRYKILWNGRDAFGTPVASGVYIYRIKAGNWQDAKRMTLLK